MHQFFWPLVLAFLFALPVVVSYLNEWLNKFAYRITLGWELLALSGLSLVVLALGVLTINGLKLARQNPVAFIKVDH